MIDFVAATKLLKSFKDKHYLGDLHQEAGEFLSLTAATIYSKISRGELPVMKRGKRLYFSRDELLEYLKDVRNKTNAEIERDANTYLLNNKKGLNTEVIQLNSPKIILLRCGNGTHFHLQSKKVFTALYGQLRSILIGSIETGVLRINIYRYIAKWEKQDCVQIALRGVCPVSKHHAGFNTTNPELFLAVIQLSIPFSYDN